MSCGRSGSPARSRSTTPSRATAQLPARVVVSRARTSIEWIIGRTTKATKVAKNTKNINVFRVLRILRNFVVETMTTTATPTPAMRQYLEAKRQYRDAIVFFRMGDFYEMFYEDALVAARALELTLTSRSRDAGGNGIPMCGVPFHAADGYVAKLVRKGFRVAICEQVEDPKKAKGLVKREVVRVVSPGTLTDANYLEAREPAYLMSIVSAGPLRGTRPTGDAEVLGVALIDVSTGEFTTAEYRGDDGLRSLADEISVLRPREIVVPADGDVSRGGPLSPPARVVERLPEIARLQVPVTAIDSWTFEPESARRMLLDQLKTHGLEGFGLDGRIA